MRVKARLQRRILINYRVDPDEIAGTLPSGFRPVVTGGYAIAGICLIRLSRVRPAGLPAVSTMTTENAAHRIAVQREAPDGPQVSVYIPRRDSDSLLTVAAGSRLFPGWHHRADVTVAERDGSFRIEVASRDGQVRVRLAARLADQMPAGSVFGDLPSASRFFGCAPSGYSARPDGRSLDGVRLDCDGWNLEPLAVEDLWSSYFEASDRLPAGSAVFDSAFLMRDLDTTWSSLPRLPIDGLSRGIRRHRAGHVACYLAEIESRRRIGDSLAGSRVMPAMRDQIPQVTQFSDSLDE
jgi:uncharacterized protein YqjF (DUF2071 family)